MAEGVSRWHLDSGPETVDDERRLLIAAFTKAAAEHGYAKLEAEQVLRHAGVPRATFEAHFKTMEQGLIAAQDTFLDRLWLDVTAACESTDEWPLKVRAAMAAVLSSLAEASSQARVFAIEATAASLAAAERQFAALDRFAKLLRDGRAIYPCAATLPEATERALVGGIASIVSGHLLVEEPQAIPRLESELVELVLIPYVGEGEARRVAGF
ncbi:MAG: TetR/AcrR family transcriptional regulator [Solirubrobacterales bacterium]